MSKQKLSPVAIATLIGVSSLLMTVPAFAQTPTPTQTRVNFFDGLIKYLADTFHLDQNQVKAAVTTYQSQHQAQHQEILDDHEKTRLDQLVKNGKLTQDQENAILDEEKVLQSKYSPQSMRDLSPTDRKAKFSQMQSEIQTWAKDHNIDPKYLMPDFGRGMKMGLRRANWRSHKGMPTTTPAPTH